MSRAIHKMGMGGQKALELAYTDFGESATTQSTPFTFSNLSIGAAKAGRLVVVTAHTDGPSSTLDVTGITIGGVAATKAVGDKSSSGSDAAAANIYYRTVSTGTTATVVVTPSGNCRGCRVEVYTLNNVQSTTPTDTGVDISDDANGVLSVTHTCPAGGAMIGAVTAKGNSGWFWTNLNEDSDGVFGAENAVHTSASTLRTTAFSGTISADGNTAQARSTLVVASWR